MINLLNGLNTKKMEDKSFLIRKIDLQAFMEILKDIYDQGADYIDLYGHSEEGQDTVGIKFNKSYMSENYSQNFDLLSSEQFPSKMEVKLSDDDLNRLID